MDGMDAIRALGALAFVLALLLGVAWALKRFGGGFGLRPPSASDLRVIESRPLDSRRKLVVLRWGEREHLLCLGPTGDSLIASREAPDRPAGGAGVRAGDGASGADSPKPPARPKGDAA